MSSKLQVIGEKEVPEKSPENQDGLHVFRRREAHPPTETPSDDSSQADSPKSVLVMMEIRRILNARASAVMAMGGAFVLTAVALAQGTMMSLGTAISFDVLVFLPLAWIAYTRK